MIRHSWTSFPGHSVFEVQYRQVPQRGFEFGSDVSLVPCRSVVGSLLIRSVKHPLARRIQFPTSILSPSSVCISTNCLELGLPGSSNTMLIAWVSYISLTPLLVLILLYDVGPALGGHPSQRRLSLLYCRPCGRVGPYAASASPGQQSWTLA